MARDDFSISTKRTLSNRVGCLCSNPSCSSLTIGPNDNQKKSINIGVAAHITAASEGGPRYNSDLTSEERSSIDNGIWLCQNCAKEIDSDEARFTVEILNGWKNTAEERAKEALGQKLLIDPSNIKSNIVVIVAKQKKTTHSKVIRSNGKVGAEIKLKALKNDNKVNDVWFPIILGEGIIPPKHNLWTIFYQNLTSKVESDILLSINCDGTLFKEVDLKETSRLEIYEGALKSASYAKFHIKTLLPNEKQSIRLIAKKGCTPEITCSNNLGQPIEPVYYFEVVL